MQAYIAKGSVLENKIYKGQSIEIIGCPFLLLADKALYWPAKQMLIIADLHLGKITHFRKSGIAVPLQAKDQNWRVLNDLIEEYQPKQVYFLGDLFHSSINNEWSELIAFMDTYKQVYFHLILGNHDILDVEVYKESRLNVVEEYTIDQFIFTHHPLEEARDDLFNLCGHIHPAVRLQGKGRQSLRMPCFYITKQQMILPSFGVFTGSKNLEIEEAMSIYGIVEGQILKIK